MVTLTSRRMDVSNPLTSKKAGFLGLPAKIRNKIMRYILVPGYIWPEVGKIMGSNEPFSSTTERTEVHTNLLATSKKVTRKLRTSIMRKTL